MTKRFPQTLFGVAILAALALAAPAFAQQPAAAAAPPAQPASANPRVALDTAAGRIVVELEATKAPITAGNFLKYVDQKRFDGATFYRASRPPGATTYDLGLVQGGLGGELSKMLPPIAHESSLQTGLKNVSGAITMARNAPGTARANFFIVVGDQTYLDADPNDPSNPGFAVFGHVVEGMDVVKQILAMPTDPEKGEGVMKGEMLAQPVAIKTARRVVP